MTLRSVLVLREDVDAVVLFAMTSPKLNGDSVFDGTPLHEIPYWRDKMRLRPVVQVEGQTYRLLFLSWQQNCAVHGKDDPHAKRNRKLLSQNQRISRLLEQESKLASEYITTLADWCHATQRPFLLFHQRKVESLHSALLGVVRSNKAVCTSARLRGSKNYKIMDCLVPARLREFAKTTG